MEVKIEDRATSKGFIAQLLPSDFASLITPPESSTTTAADPQIVPPTWSALPPPFTSGRGRRRVVSWYCRI